MGEGGEGGAEVREEEGRVREGLKDKEKGFCFNVYYVVVHGTTANETALGVVHLG